MYLIMIRMFYISLIRIVYIIFNLWCSCNYFGYSLNLSFYFACNGHKSFMYLHCQFSNTNVQYIKKLTRTEFRKCFKNIFLKRQFRLFSMKKNEYEKKSGNSFINREDVEERRSIKVSFSSLKTSKKTPEGSSRENSFSFP